LALALEPVDSEAVGWVIAGAEAELELRYGFVAEGEQTVSLDQFAAPTGAFLVARIGTLPVGGVGLRQAAPEVAEIKRLWTDPAWRGHGVGGALMTRLEAVAGQLGYPALWLATGTRQPEAVALYERLGWARLTAGRDGGPIPSYSIQFAKDLPLHR
jgi:GNAT superfamily N-acetyltransferase